MVLAQAAAWRAISSRGLADLSAPEAQHALLELPTDRADYLSVLQDIGDYPARSAIAPRMPSPDEIAALAALAGRWRAIVLLDDERALRLAASLFSRVFVLDPFYDTGAMLYAAWHDPFIRDEHSRSLAEQAGLLVRAGALLKAGTAVLAPDHLPGSWNPRPGWKKPRREADARQQAGWSMRTSLVLLYWSDRLDGVVCATRPDVRIGLDVALGPRVNTCSLDLAEPRPLGETQAGREATADDLGRRWAAVRRISRQRRRSVLQPLAGALSDLSTVLGQTEDMRPWRLTLGQATLPDPALLVRRVLNGQDPEREPRLPHQKIRRAPLCLTPASSEA